VALLLASAPAAFASCPTVRFLGVRGSGEHSGFGYTVGDVLATVNHSLSNVNVGNWTDDYWAVNVNPQEPRYNSEYITSVKQGIKNLQAEVQSSVQSCSSVPLLIAGYSQGAEVVDDWFLSAEANGLRGHVVGIVLLGDPRFNPAQELPVDQGSFNHRRQGVGPIQFRPAGGTFGTLVNYSAADANMIRSFCVAHDPICNYAGGDMAACSANGVWSFLASCAHLNYQKLKISGSETYTTAAGRFLVSRYHAMPRIDAGSTGTGSSGTVSVSIYGPPTSQFFSAKVDGRVLPESLGETITRFGQPASEHRYGQNGENCSVSWPSAHVTGTFTVALGGTYNGCAPGASTMILTLGPGWRTDTGLSVGQSVANLRRLYPDARATGNDWTLVEYFYGAGYYVTELGAMTSGGTITALTVAGVPNE
jgi:cutinase